MRATRDELPVIFGADPAAIRGADWDGLRSMIISLPAGTDLEPLLKGLPNNLCPCPHWGYVLKGRIRVTYADGVEYLRAGDLFDPPPGHTPFVEEDVEFVEFSRPAEHRRRPRPSSSATPPPIRRFSACLIDSGTIPRMGAANDCRWRRDDRHPPSPRRHRPQGKHGSGRAQWIAAAQDGADNCVASGIDRAADLCESILSSRFRPGSRSE